MIPSTLRHAVKVQVPYFEFDPNLKVRQISWMDPLLMCNSLRPISRRLRLFWQKMRRKV